MRRVRRPLRRVLVVLAVCCAAMAAWSAAAGGQSQPPSPRPDAAALMARGRVLFAQGCASCHGEDLRGRPGWAATARRRGGGGRLLPLDRAHAARRPDRRARAHAPAYPRADIDALVAFVGSFGGPGLPRVDPARGSLATGMAKFTEHCAGCHQIVGRGGIVTGAAVPALDDATPTQLAEAVRVGPYLMPKFSAGQIDQATLDSIARYVQSIRHPDNRGGWGIGNLGPVPEGMVTWFLAMAALLAVARLIGERAP